MSDKLYKPKSRMQQLAEEFQKSKAVTEDFKASKVSQDSLDCCCNKNSMVIKYKINRLSFM